MKIVFGYLAVLLVTLVVQDSESLQICSCKKEGSYCLGEWTPVCGMNDGVQCTFSNLCYLGSCQYVHDGECKA